MSIYCLMGKSATGKDTVYKLLLSEKKLKFIPIIPATTRPVRSNEKDGVDYRFFTDEEFERFKDRGKVVEYRTYNTIHGMWNYFTLADDEIRPKERDYLYIGTLEAYLGLREYYGGENVSPIYLYVADDGERLQRALSREREMKEPKYAEMCRRFLGDEEDFSQENIDRAGILTENKFENDDAMLTAKRISEWISG